MNENYQQARSVQPQNGNIHVTNLYDAGAGLFRWPNDLGDPKLVGMIPQFLKKDCPHKLSVSFENTIACNLYAPDGIVYF
jgi:hypothetical protein